MEHVNVVSIDENTRIVVDYSRDATCPREYEDEISVFCIVKHPKFASIAEGKGTHNEALQDIVDKTGADTMKVIDNILGYLKKAGVSYVTSLTNKRMHVWYWDGNSLENSIAETILWQSIERYDAWAQGDVYDICVERRRTWTAQDNPKDTMHTWEYEDGVYGEYCDAMDDEEVKAIAIECGLLEEDKE